MAAPRTLTRKLILEGGLIPWLRRRKGAAPGQPHDLERGVARRPSG